MSEGRQLFAVWGKYPRDKDNGTFNHPSLGLLKPCVPKPITDKQALLAKNLINCRIVYGAEPMTQEDFEKREKVEKLTDKQMEKKIKLAKKVNDDNLHNSGNSNKDSKHDRKPTELPDSKQ